MAEFLPEILVHLDGSNPDLIAEATRALVQILHHDESIVLDAATRFKIQRGVIHSNMDIASSSAALLTNIIALHPELAKDVDIAAIFGRTIQICNSDKSQSNTFLMLLSNLTLDEEIADKLVRCAAFATVMPSLVELFLSYMPQAVETEDATDFDYIDCYQYAGSLICNLSRVAEFRKFLLNISSDYYPRLFSQVNVLSHTFDHIAT